MSKKLTQEEIAKVAKFLKPVRCHSGHETMIPLWNCPICTNQLTAERDQLKAEKKELAAELDKLKKISAELLEECDKLTKINAGLSEECQGILNCANVEASDD